MTKIAGSGSGPKSGSIGQRHGSADPDPQQNVMDQEHWYHHSIALLVDNGYVWKARVTVQRIKTSLFYI
jgi:hypothetical protein